MILSMPLIIRGVTKFHRSLIIALCPIEVHFRTNDHELEDGYFELQAISSLSKFKTSENADSSSSGNASVTLDLHTKTALIGREDLDVSLEFLRLHEESIDGYIDIYAVTRILEKEKIGDAYCNTKDRIYTLTNSWV